MLDKFTAFLNSLKFLNWTRVVELGAIILILISALTFYENRQKVYDSVGANKFESYRSMVISEKTKNRVNEIVHRIPLVAGLHIVEVNFVKNERSTVYQKFDDYDLETGYKKYLENKIANPTIFSNIEHNNQRIIRLINGEFVCLPYKATMAVSFPGGDKNISTVCSISIPPLFGKFRGYLTAYVKKGHREDEIAQIRIMLITLSQEIYENDLR